MNVYLNQNDCVGVCLMTCLFTPRGLYFSMLNVVFILLVCVFVFVFAFECLPAPKLVCGFVPSDLSIYAAINSTHVPLSSCMQVTTKSCYICAAQNKPTNLALHSGKLVCVKICKFLQDNDHLFLVVLTISNQHIIQ